MNNQITEITNILLELRSASISIIDDPMPIMNKYDMLFLGEKFNTIYTMELAHCLKEKFNIEIGIEALNSMIPNICSSLNMKCETLIAVSDAGKPNPPVASYAVTLF